MALWIFGLFWHGSLFVWLSSFHDQAQLKNSALRKRLLGALPGSCGLPGAVSATINPATANYNALSLMVDWPHPTQLFLTTQRWIRDQNQMPSYQKMCQQHQLFQRLLRRTFLCPWNQQAYVDRLYRPWLRQLPQTEEHIWVDPQHPQNLNDDVVLVSLYVSTTKNYPTRWFPNRGQ